MPPGGRFAKSGTQPSYRIEFRLGRNELLAEFATGAAGG
jgi:hypothetical protein